MIETAAVALLNGWADPLALLDLPPDKWAVAVAVINAADKQRGKEQSAMADAIAGRTARWVNAGTRRIVESALKSLK